jgi:polyvinyl alcohol dehydrogenase (cytochrome)
MVATRRGMLRCVLPVVLTVAVACAGGGSGDADRNPGPGTTRPPSPGTWSSFGFDNANSRFNAGETALSPTSVKTLAPSWHVEGLAGLAGTPAVVDGIVYAGDWKGEVHAWDAATGRPLWTTPLGGGTIMSSPTIAGDALYVIGGRMLHRLDRATGAVRWRTAVSDHPIAIAPASPVAVDGLVLQGMASGELIFRSPQYTFRGSLAAFDANTGEERWRRWFTANDATSGAGVGIWSTPSLDTARGLAYVGTGNTYAPPAAPLSDSVVAIRYGTGEIAWSKQFTYPDVWSIGHAEGLDADVGAGPNLWSAKGRDLVGAGDKRGVYHALDRVTGEVVWETPMTGGSTLGGVIGTAAYGEGHLYVGSNVGGPGNSPTGTAQVLALHATTGTVVWRHDLPGAIYASITAVPGLVLVGTTEKAMVALDARGGQELWRFTAPEQVGGGPSVVDGTVYWGYGFAIAGPGSGIGGLYAFRPGGPPPAAVGPGGSVPASRGAEVFRASCASCHGPEGQGGVGPSMKGIAERRSEAEHLRVVREGIEGSQMKGFQEVLSEADIAAVVDYERTRLSPG